MKHSKVIVIILGLILVTGVLRVVWHPLRLDRFGSAKIEWADFVRVDGRTYNADAYVSDDNTVEVSTIPEDGVGEKLGSVRFTMENKVSNPEYRLHDWDASYLPTGTEIYSVLGSSNTVAVLLDGVYYRYSI